jgi:hypothetical protein
MKIKSDDPVTEAIAETFECMKIAFNQDVRHGHTFTFAVAPEDVPEHLLKARLMTRFACSLVEIGDDEKPVLKEGPKDRQKRKMNASVMRAGIACKEILFNRFLQRNYSAEWTASKSEGEGEMQAAAAMRKILDIESRKDLGINPDALLGFDRLMAEYEVWKRGELK